MTYTVYLVTHSTPPRSGDGEVIYDYLEIDRFKFDAERRGLFISLPGWHSVPKHSTYQIAILENGSGRYYYGYCTDCRVERRSDVITHTTVSFNIHESSHPSEEWGMKQDYSKIEGLFI